MKVFSKLLIACIPLLGLAACGGGDTEDRLDIADPAVRFIDVSAIAANVTLYRASTAQADASNVGPGFASNYFDVGLGVADWSVKTAAGGAPLGSVSLDPQRGTKYTIVALDSSASANAVYLIVDPYNKPLTSDSTRVRLMNAAFNAGSVDFYMNQAGTDIDSAGVTPIAASIAFDTSGPATGSDSVSIPAGTWDVTVTSAGTKTVLFRGRLVVVSNQDLLFLAVPDAGGVKVLVKTEGTAGTTGLTPS